MSRSMHSNVLVPVKLLGYLLVQIGDLFQVNSSVVYAMVE